LSSIAQSRSTKPKALRERTFLGHPLGLYVLFFTEMWERFSFYGMRVLLVLYMTDYLLKKDLQPVWGMTELKSLLESMHGALGIQPFSSHIYGLYTSLVYLTPVFGGLIADRYFGQRKTVVLGGVLMAIGHFLMAFENYFLIALIFLIFGNGFFKPNLSTQVGALYPQGDTRRDGAYTIYYMGINLGAMLAPLVCGTLGQFYGWHYGFGAAGVGMVVGLLLYMWSHNLLAPDDIHERKATAHLEKPLSKNEWRAIAGLVALCLLNIIPWCVYEQQGNTMQIFADRNTDWHIFGYEMPSTWFQFFNPFFIFVLGPFLNMFWSWQAKHKCEQTSVIKMAIGCALLGLGFLFLIPITSGLGDNQRISFLWLVGATFVYTLGELYLSPVGLSLVTKVAPARIVGMMMGIWFLSIFVGNYISGSYVGTLYESMPKNNFFLMLGVLALLASLSIFALNKPIRKAIGNV